MTGEASGSNRQRALWLALALCLAPSGCDGGGPDGDGDVDGDVDADADSDVDVDADADGDSDGDQCRGCRSPDGACQSGASDTACGSGGAPCVACGPSEWCVEGGCVAPPSCGPASCEGCCDGDDCLPGDQDSACGRGGLACARCDWRCGELGCELPCELGCGGCCDASGSCLGGDDEAACGRSGAACARCPAGSACSLGECIASACAESCDGCCSADSCLGGDSATACGSGGEACTDCGPSRVCVLGACAVDEASRWDLVVVSGSVPELGADGEPWDSFGGLPDPFVGVTVAGETETHSGETSVLADSLVLSWSETALSAVPARDLRRGIVLTIYDDDVVGDDVVSVCRLTPTDDQFSDGLVALACPANARSDPPTVAAELSIRIRRH